MSSPDKNISAVYAHAAFAVRHKTAVNAEEAIRAGVRAVHMWDNNVKVVTLTVQLYARYVKIHGKKQAETVVTNHNQRLQLGAALSNLCYAARTGTLPKP
jgi:hypothetical protein